jgi:hypothetical protein
MANTFKRATKSSLSTAAVASDSATNILTATGANTLIIIGMITSNKTATSATVDLYLLSGTGDPTYLLRNAPVPAGSSLEYVNSSKLVMNAGDVLRARANTSSALDITVSYLEQS